MMQQLIDSLSNSKPKQKNSTMTTSETIQPNSEMNPDQLQSDMNTIKNVLTETDKDQDIHRIIIAAS